MADLLYPTPAADEVLQGDIFADMPSVYVESRPLRVARWYKKERDKAGEHDLWEVHTDDGPGPKGGFNWKMSQGGERSLLVHAHLSLAVLISHDCEIEHDQNARTLAMIRPIGEFDKDTQERLFSGKDEDVVYGLFPLEAQDEEPKIERSVVDFRRLTTVRPAVLKASTRVASASDEIRKAMARRFRQYLFRRLQVEASDD